MSDVTLQKLTDFEVEDLYDQWVDFDQWPAGEFFASLEDLVAVEQAIESGDLHLFKVEHGEGGMLFGLVVTASPVHVDLFPSGGVELTLEMGASTLASLVKWAFENSGTGSVVKYLDTVEGEIHNQFLAWGFENPDAGKEAESVEAGDEDSDGGAETETTTPVPSNGEELGEVDPDAFLTGDVDHVKRSWVSYRLDKAGFNGTFPV